jgi:hypothetical protein
VIRLTLWPLYPRKSDCIRCPREGLDDMEKRTFVNLSNRRPSNSELVAVPTETTELNEYAIGNIRKEELLRNSRQI